MHFAVNQYLSKVLASRNFAQGHLYQSSAVHELVAYFLRFAVVQTKCQLHQWPKRQWKECGSSSHPASKAFDPSSMIWVLQKGLTDNLSAWAIKDLWTAKPCLHQADLYQYGKKIERSNENLCACVLWVWSAAWKWLHAQSQLIGAPIGHTALKGRAAELHHDFAGRCVTEMLDLRCWE